MGNPLNRDAGPLVEWDKIGRSRFDQLVEALIPYQHPEDSDVRLISGIGGDGGRDAVVTEPDGRKIIYQLKYFPEGFDGKHRDRRRQISNPSKNQKSRGSFEHALDHNPDEWILVTPCNPSVSGWAWISELQKEHRDRVKISFVGRAQLDGERWCAGHQAVVRSLHTRDELLAKAHILNKETAVLARPSDLSDRVQALAGVVDDVDPAWTLDFARVGQNIVQTLRPKHPSAAQTNPLSTHFRIVGPVDDPRVSAFVRAIDYGSFDPVSLPGELIADYRVTGTSLLEHDELEQAIASIELHPAVRTPEQQLSILIKNKDDRVTATHSGVVTRVSHGAKGLTLEHILYGVLSMTWNIPKDPGIEGAVVIAFDSTRAADASALLRALRLAESLAGAAKVELRVRATSIMRVVLAESSKGVIKPEAEAGRALVETVEDLAHVQHETNIFFPVPESISTIDRIWLRVLRRALEGRMCFAPEARTAYNAALSPEILKDTERIPLLAGEAAMLLVQPESSTFELDGHEMPLPGPLAFLMRSVRLQDVEAVYSNLERGEIATAVIQSDHDRHVVAYMPSRTSEGTLVVPEPWGLTDIDEVPEIGPAG